MNKDVFQKITEQSRFTVPAFGGSILFQGRILSPSEAESAGLLQYLIASQLLSRGDNDKLGELREHAKKVADSEPSAVAELIDQARKLGFRPEVLPRLHEHQDKIVCQVIRAASLDGGQSWEQCKLVTAEEQQNPELGMIWIGLLSSEDRQAIIKKALQGHKGAEDRIAGFLSGKPV